MHNTNNPKFSIIISTYNRAKILSKALESISAQPFEDFEIIISDDASTDNTKEVVDNFNDIRITYMRNQENSGLSVTRNAALRKARGEYVVMMDDDSVLSNNFLPELSKLVTKEKIGVFCPKILDPVTKYPFVKIFDDDREKYLGYSDFYYFIGLAHVFSCEVIKRSGYYDEKFGVGGKYFSAEESDYFFRLKRLNVKILYSPQLVVYHPQESDVPDSKVFRYSYGIAAMLTKQILSDKKHFYIYFFLLLKRIIISLLRTLQCILFPMTIVQRNRIYKYKYFLKGSVIGALEYLRFR